MLLVIESLAVYVANAVRAPSTALRADTEGLQGALSLFKVRLHRLVRKIKAVLEYGNRQGVGLRLHCPYAIVHTAMARLKLLATLNARNTK